VVGIVSQRDLFRAALSSLLQLRREAEHEWLAMFRVRSIMTSHVFSVAPSVTLYDAVEIMLDKRIGCLPVVENGKLVGLLSERDCLRHLARLLTKSNAAPA